MKLREELPCIYLLLLLVAQPLRIKTNNLKWHTSIRVQAKPLSVTVSPTKDLHHLSSIHVIRPLSKAQPLCWRILTVKRDSRSNEQPMLTALHTLFLREHNRLAKELHKLNPRWSGEKLYQEARKIIGAVFQKVTYKDWLPLLLGDETSKELPPYKSYSEDVDPAAANVFTIGFRMGHTLVRPCVYRLAEDYSPASPEPAVPLYQTFFAPWRIVREGGIDPILRGMMLNKAKLNRQDQIMVDALRERLFPVVNNIGRDLASFNIQRGRDHGLPGYNEWRKFCGLSAPNNLDELADVLKNRELAKKLIKLYGIGRIGKTLTCLIGNQFHRLRTGDRFYFENSTVFSSAQRRSIESVTLAQIICANTNIKKVPPNVFTANDYPADFMECSNFPVINLTPWKA
ncbi:hypothetical protein GDO81_006739 [Engystomops pustulosus]|uniref:Peroxidase n=1 Tax=Engystomops pustulosus TaxID=76066 RepID=A0AAV7D0B5_ENGPU|nr:hypothetical protein GDO81_006739 [Engystomops pustulosus]